jgi:protein tyrosine phosphatase
MADSVTAWFEENPKNVIAVHCKGGKGRTGTMISVALLKTGVCQTAKVKNNIFSHYNSIVHSSCFLLIEEPFFQ